MTVKLRTTHRLAWIPFALVGLRVALTPILALQLSRGSVGPAFYLLLSAALASDIVDGVIARRIGTSTVRLRVLDGVADTALYGSLALAVFFAHRAEMTAFATSIAILIAGRVALYAFSFARFGRAPSYHGVTAKAWGLGMTFAFALIGSNADFAAALWIALILGYVNTVDEVVTTAMLRTWQSDVLTIGHALRLRRSTTAARIS